MAAAFCQIPARVIQHPGAPVRTGACWICWKHKTCWLRFVIRCALAKSILKCSPQGLARMNTGWRARATGKNSLQHGHADIRKADSLISFLPAAVPALPLRLSQQQFLNRARLVCLDVMIENPPIPLSQTVHPLCWGASCALTSTAAGAATCSPFLIRCTRSSSCRVRDEPERDRGLVALECYSPVAGTLVMHRRWET